MVKNFILSGLFMLAIAFVSTGIVASVFDASANEFGVTFAIAALFSQGFAPLLALD